MLSDALLAQVKANLLWIKIGLVVALSAVLFGAGWFINGWRWEAKENSALQKAIEERDAAQAEYRKAVQESVEQSTLDAAKLSSLETQKDTLLATLNGLKFTRTITVKPNVQGECESAVLDDAFRVYWNAVVTQAYASGAAPADGGH